MTTKAPREEERALRILFKCGDPQGGGERIAALCYEHLREEERGIRICLGLWTRIRCGDIREEERCHRFSRNPREEERDFRRVFLMRVQDVLVCHRADLSAAQAKVTQFSVA